MAQADVVRCKVFIAGTWVDSDASETSPVFNPSDGAQIAATPMCGAAEVEKAIRAAEAAFPEWSETPSVERARLLFRFKALMDDHKEELAQLITREHGKTLEESRGSVQRGIEVVEFACGAPALLMGEAQENVANNVDYESHRHPLGVCASITPFNFPLMVPLWSLPVALVCGNTYVLKPSEKVPLSAIRMVELLEEAGLPPGVLNLVHGGKEAVDTLLTNPAVKAVTFVGSTPVAKYIYETATKHGKRVQSSGGAKNAMVVMPDADIDVAVDGVMGSAYGCAGERCMAGSVLICPEDAGERFLPAFLAAASSMRVGPTDRDPEAQMGPLVTGDHLQRVTACVEKGVKEGATLALDGRSVQVDAAPNGFYLGPTLFDHVRPEMSIATDEIFGPVLSTIRTGDLEEALAFCNRSEFGNAAVMFTQSGRSAREFRHRVNAGMVGINIGVPAPTALFPFAGWNNSFFGDLHVQGQEGVAFFTRQKVTITRW